MSTLNEIMAAKQNALALIADDGGEVTPEMEALLTSIDQNFGEKADSYAYLTDELEAQSQYFAAMAKEFKRKADAIDNLRIRLRDRIKAVMLELGETRIQGTNFEWALSKMKAKVVIDGVIPGEYNSITYHQPTVAPDKEKITEALKAGEKIPGAHFEDVFALRSKIVKKAKLKGTKDE